MKTFKVWLLLTLLVFVRICRRSCDRGHRFITGFSGHCEDPGIVQLRMSVI